MGMTEKQKRFADEYLIDLNGTRAYKVAYPRVKNDETASANASRMLRIAKVKTYINEQLEKMHNEKTADAQEVLEYLTAVLRGESKSEIVVVEGIGDGCSSASRMEKAPDEKERLKAAELLGKRYSLFTDKVDVSGSLETEKSKLDDLVKQLMDPDG
ncbi:MAG: terminase small subunit [Eubacterium sp.]